MEYRPAWRRIFLVQTYYLPMHTIFDSVPKISKLTAVLGSVFSCSVLLAGCGGDASTDTASAQRSISPRQAAAVTVSNGVTTVTADSCSYADVSAAVTEAQNLKQIGTIVSIPAGRCDWQGNELKVQPGITLKGAGRDLTYISRTTAIPASSRTYLVRFECYVNGTLPVRFSDMTLVGANISSGYDRGLGIVGGCEDFVVTRSKFTHFVFAGIEVKGPAGKQKGVIYSNQFINNYNTQTRTYGYGVAVFGDTGDWPALELGTGNAVFVEDNYMLGNRHHIASNYGARYVFRYNRAIATDATRDFPQVDVHGHQSDVEAQRGARSWEIYNNIFEANLSAPTGSYVTQNRAAIGIRGGDGYVADNTYGPRIARQVELSIEGTITGGACTEMRLKDRIREAYILSGNTVSIPENCSRDYIRFGKQIIQDQAEYTDTAPVTYQRYAYPHPKRAGV